MKLCAFSWDSTHFFIPRPQSNSKKCDSQKLKERKSSVSLRVNTSFLLTQIQKEKFSINSFVTFTWLIKILFSKIWVTISTRKRNATITWIKIITRSGKESMVYIYIHTQHCRILFNLRKEGNPVICNTDEPEGMMLREISQTEKINTTHITPLTCQP